MGKWWSSRLEQFLSRFLTNIKGRHIKMKTKSMILDELCNLIGKYTSLSRDQINPNVPFLEMGADSLVLLRIIHEIKGMYGVEIAIHTLYEQLNSLNAIVKYIVDNLPNETYSDQASAESKKEMAVSNAQAMHNPHLAENATEKSTKVPVKNNMHVLHRTETAPNEQKKKSWQTAKSEIKSRDYSANQQQHLEDLIRRYNRKTQKSKELTQKYRTYLADSKATVGFRMSLKEMLYPIIGAKTQGSRLWDIDGNEYVDVTMGFGTHMFGYRPDFIINAIKKYLDEGVQLGPRSAMIGETAKMICEMTGFDRVAFANTGTEANMATFRLIRAVTGKSRIAVFRNSYHGHCDYTLAEGQVESEDGGLISLTPGIPQSVLSEVLVLDYGDPQSLDKIVENRHELAGVLVEPVQGRNPLLQPIEFLHSLRDLTLKLDIPLVFDEMITGFRCHPAGAQGLFGVKADIATYGKSIGGGLPIGIIAGNAKYLDRIDGGFWSYGDQSFPQAERTFFGGTFCQHPMVIPVTNAIIKHLKEQGPSLQKSLTEKTERMANTLNDYFTKNMIPIRVAHFASVFRFEMTGDLDLFCYHMIERGVYIWEWRVCFISAAHTDEDIDFIIQAAKESAEDLRLGGFLPKDTPAPKDLTYTPPKEIKRLTDEQKQLWLLSQFGINGEGSVAYNVTLYLMLEGDLYLNVMKNALKELTKRHEALRSTIDIEGVFQKIHKTASVELKEIDLTSYEGDKQKEAVDNWIKEYNKQPFDLVNKPGFEVAILKLTTKKHILVLKAHHIFADGISIELILEELSEIYSAGCEIRTPRLPESINTVYYDEEEIRKDNLRYWTHRFETAVSECELPYDYRRPQNRIQKGADKLIHLDKAIHEKLTSLAIDSNVSLYMVLFTVFASFIARISGNDEIVVNIPANGRYGEESQRVVGHHTVTLPVRTKIVKNRKFTEQLKQTSKDLMEALEHQNFSFSELCKRVKEKWPELINNYKFPISSVSFNCAKVTNNFDFSESKASIYRVPATHYVDRDIFFDFDLTKEQLLLDCVYSSDLFADETIDRLLKSFVMYMADTLQDPDKTIKNISMITEEEKRIILHDFNDTKAEYPKDKTIVDLFEEQVEKTPDDVAVVYEEQQLTYKQLNKKANQVAHRLRKLGVKPDDFVMIIANRSIEMIVAIYGVLKSGAAYVPIDPNYPQSRIEYMMNDCQPKCILAAYAEVPVDTDIPIVDLTNEDVYSGASANPKKVNKPSDLAYVIYTSGTTGKPKGVMIEEHNLTNYITYACKNYLKNQAYVPLFTNIAFDLTVTSVFMPLVSGGTMIVFDSEADISLGEIFQKSECTVIKCTPMHLNLASEITIGESNVCIDSIILGGEVLYAETAKNILNKYGESIDIHNEYGPTETTVGCCDYIYNPEIDVKLAVGIGKPISNTKIYILDGKQLCGIGIPGELCIAGAGVARGYLNNPELTAEKFVDNPFGEGKMYRSGDLARWLPDGNIEYLGRIDDQVKIRGFRIELGEIESAIRSLEEVKDCAVIAKNDASGEKAIYAYIVSDEEISISSVRDRLGEVLPSYMIPAYMGQIETIPVTNNGKLDKRDLPEIEAGSTHEYVAPETAEELNVVRAFSEILGVKNIGVNDDFFEMGGDSIKAIRVVSKIRELGYELSVMELMHTGTPSAIALKLEQVNENRYTQDEVNGSVELIPIQRQFFESDYAVPSHYNQSIMLFRRNGFNVEILKKAIREIVVHHDILRSVFVDGQQITLASEESKLYDFYEYDTASDLGYEKEIESKCSKIQASIDLEKGPLFKVGLFHTENGDHLLLCAHHLVIDGVSWRILLEDLMNGYTQAEEVGEITLPLKTASYKQWAQNLVEYADSEELKNEIPYWDKIVSTMEPGRIANELKTIQIELGTEDTKALLYDSSKAYGTEINDLLLTALGIAYHDWTGKDKVTIDLEGHGREQVGKPMATDRTIGWFTSVYPTRLTAFETVETSIIETKEMLRRIPNHGIGYGILKYNKDKYRNVGSEICFNYLGHFDNEMKSNELLTASSISTGRSVAIRNKLNNGITFDGSVFNSRLVFDITYDGGRYTDEDINLLGTYYLSAISDVVKTCFGHMGRQSMALKQFLNKNIPKYLDNYKSNTLNKSYLPLIMQEVWNEEIVTEFVKLNTNLDNAVSIIKSVVKEQDVFRTRYNKETGMYEEYSYNEDWFIPVLNLTNYQNPEEIYKSYIDRLYAENMLFNSKLLSMFVLAEKSENECYVIYSVHHSIWDRRSSELFEEKIEDIVERGPRVKGGKSYTKYCSSIKSNVEKHISTPNETKFFSEFKEAVDDNLKAIATHRSPSIASNFRIKLTKMQLEAMNENPLTSMMTVFGYLFYGESVSGSKYPFLVLQHNRNKTNSDLLGLVLDYDCCLFDADTQKVAGLERKDFLPLSEKILKWSKTHISGANTYLFYTVPAINFLGVFLDRSFLDENRVIGNDNDILITYSESKFRHECTGVECTISKDILEGTIYGYRLDKTNLSNAMEIWNKHLLNKSEDKQQ